jgi:hypothetical protein
MMAIGFLIPLIFLVLLIFGIRKLAGATKDRGGSAFTIREIFQYLIMFGVMIISGVGISGLLGRLFDFNRVISESRTDLARNLTFTLVGVPLLTLLGRWTSLTLKRDARERFSLSWIGYTTIALITTLSLSLSGIHDLLSWAIGNDPYSGNSLARAIVWSVAWIIHWRISREITRSAFGNAHLVVGSTIGLVLLEVGIGGIIGNSIESLFDAGSQKSIAGSKNPIINSAINIAIGSGVWLFYWLRNLKARERSLLWYLYLFLAGIAASFMTFVASISVVAYEILVWFFGDVGGKSATEHFASVSQPIGSALIGLAVWWYHRAVLGSHEQSEIRRIYEYIISGVSLIASSLGLLMIFVALIEAVTPTDLVSSTSQANTLIVAVTLLLIGTPVWWFFWRRIQRRVSQGRHDEMTDEVTSPTRRIFILMLFGVAGIAAVISIIVAVFFFFDDLLNNQLSRETLRSARFALGILVTNGTISTYHWSIYRKEKMLDIRRVRKEKYVLLVGPSDGEFARELQKKIGGKVQMWETPESALVSHDGEIWDMDAIEKLIQENTSEEIMILNEKRKLRAIPIHRP